MNKELLIGIDLGGTNIKGALLDQDGEIIEKREMATLANAGPEAVSGRIADIINNMTSLADGSGNHVIGVGIGIPGLPDKDRGAVVFAPNLRWRNVSLVDYLRRHINLPIFLENDANLAALGEQWRGAGRGSKHMIMITIGTGIGGGLIINGELYGGANGSAGEIGHMVIDPEGHPCNCGRRGCLETYTSATSMVRRAKEAIDQGRETILAREENLEAKDIFMAAEAGDRIAVEIVNYTAYYLGIGLGNTINMFNPDTIVVGGGVSRAGSLLFDPLREATIKWSLEVPASVVKIVPAELGNDAGTIGAACLVLRKKRG